MAADKVRAIHPSLPATALVSGGDVRVGRIVGVTDGRPRVSFGAHSDLAARVALPGLRDTPAAMLDGQPVLLLLENGDPALPIIVGLVGATLPGLGPEDRANEGFEVNGKRLSFEGKEEVELRCGQASITLRADGQVIVMGTRLMSRATGSNKIRGATVLIN